MKFANIYSLYATASIGTMSYYVYIMVSSGGRNSTLLAVLIYIVMIIVAILAAKFVIRRHHPYEFKKNVAEILISLALPILLYFWDATYSYLISAIILMLACLPNFRFSSIVITFFNSIIILSALFCYLTLQWSIGVFAIDENAHFFDRYPAFLLIILTPVLLLLLILAHLYLRTWFVKIYNNLLANQHESPTVYSHK